MKATAIVRDERAPTHPQPAGCVLNIIAKQAASKGFRLHHCVPITGATPEYWMLQRGGSMRIIESMERLQTVVADMTEYRCKTPEAAAEEAALRSALDELNDGAEGGAA